jgi:PLP dependent protein
MPAGTPAPLSCGFVRARICAVTIDIAGIESNWAEIRGRVDRAASRSGRAAEDVTIVAVSKTFPAEAIRAAYSLGLRDFGENRVQEFEGKYPMLDELDASWHLIGHLQSNKVRRAVQLFSAVDSVDSLSLAEKLNVICAELAADHPGRLSVLIEVRLAPEDSKNGVLPEDLPALVEAAIDLSHLEIRGLMAIPPFFEDAGRVRPYFKKLRELRDDLRARFVPKDSPLLRELSMGMSHDFEIAIEEGATQIRVGTALFGSRTKV